MRELWLLTELLALVLTSMALGVVIGLCLEYLNFWHFRKDKLHE